MTKELEKRQTIAVAGALTVEAVVTRVAMVQQIMKTVMKEGVHYGVIPGCNKPSLLKPGAETLGVAFQMRPEYEEKVNELPNNHREYIIKCRLYSIETGKEVGSGLGSCSTMESKYRWRKEERKCPECGAEAIIKGKEQYGGGWLCWKKKEGCGAKFKDGDRAIEGQVVERVENPDIADTYNTVLKMGKKRSHIDSVLTATGASDIFTQDIEDLPADMINRQPVDVTKATVITTVASDSDMPWNTDSTPLKDLELWMQGHYHGRQKEAGDMLEKAFGTRKWSEVKSLPADRIETGLKQMKLWIDGEPAEPAEPVKTEPNVPESSVGELLEKSGLIDAGKAEGEKPEKGDSREPQPIAKVVRLSPENEAKLTKYHESKNISRDGCMVWIKKIGYPLGTDPKRIMETINEHKPTANATKPTIDAYTNDLRWSMQLVHEWYDEGVNDDN